LWKRKPLSSDVEQGHVVHCALNKQHRSHSFPETENRSSVIGVGT
jgi:hypothetical protein